MQSIVPPALYNLQGYTETEILESLRGVKGTRKFSFRYELLDSSNVFVQDLTNVLDCTIDQNWLADIKRKAKFTVTDTGEINFLSDRIKPYIRLHMTAGGYVEWPQGVFLLSSPVRTSNESNTVVRDVDAYDALQVFLDDKVTDRYTVAAGANYITSVSTLLGSITKNVTTLSSTLPTAREWEPGTAKLTIINNLLSAVNYEALSFDEDGVAIVKPYASPSDRAEEYTYADDATSIMVPDVEQALDLFSIPNKWVLVVSDPDRATLTGTYTNNDPTSPTSTVQRQRTIVDFRTEVDAADLTTLNAKAERLAFEASQIYEAIDFTTGLNPIHSGNDVYRITYGALAVNAKYSEHTWSMSLKAGSTMKHRARRVVQI